MIITEDWVYKPVQLIEAVYGIQEKDEDGDIKKEIRNGITTFQIKTINVLFQALNNSIKKKEIEIDEAGYTRYKIPLDVFLDKMGYSQDDIHYVASELKKIPSLVSTTLYKDGGLDSFSIIPRVKLDSETRIIYYKVSDIIEYIFKNNFVVLEDDKYTHAKTEKGEDLCRYARVHNKSFESHKDAGLNRTVILYEYLISNRFLNEERKHIKINIEKFKKMLYCEKYNKNSQIITRILKPIIENLKFHYGLDVYYKCELNGRYKRISSISFEAFVLDNDIGNMLHQRSELQTFTTKKEVYFGEPHKNILSFKSQEELNMMIECEYTNVPYREIQEKVDIIHRFHCNEKMKDILIEKGRSDKYIKSFFDNTDYDKYFEYMKKINQIPVDEEKFKNGYLLYFNK